MSKWKLFGRSKEKEEEKPQEEKEDISEETQEDKPLAEYSETIYSTESSKKKSKSKKSSSSNQRVWRDVDSIEKHVDNIHVTQAQKPVTEVDKKVDKLIKEPKAKKASNVIYVVSKPQPGSVKGDWAVRSHHKIFSHHRLKEAAIKEARKIAKEKDATVMVQNTDGTFSDGFKPKAKK